MPILKNISTLYTCREDGGQDSVHPIENGAVIWQDDIIEWVGTESSIPAEYEHEPIIDAANQIVVPGLVDCHTHLAFGGWRPDEFEMRVRGQSYLEIAKAGGGILSTVRATREATEDELFDKSAKLLQRIGKLGVTTIECKSGYGLTLEDELKTLKVYRRLSETMPLHLVSTFLGAHTIPPEFKNRREEYIKVILEEMIPAVAEQNLARFCDIFVEESAFTVDEALTILEKSKEYGLKPKLHADQLTSGGGAELAAEVEAVSADHLEQVSDQGIRDMAQKNVVGVTLPIASLYTQQPYLDCRRLVEGGVEVAVATDFNPGSAPSYDLPLAMMLSCNHGRLTPAQALKGATIYAAKAIGLENKVGSVEPGKSADFLLLDLPSINFWLYHFTPDVEKRVYLKGEVTDSSQ